MITTPSFMELEGLRHRWGWFLGLGIVMLILGTIALIIAPAATLGTVLVLGWLIVFSGVDGSDSRVSHAQVGRNFPSPDRRHPGDFHRTDDRHTSSGRRTRMDTTFCFILHRNRNLPSDCCHPAEVSKLGVGSLRRRGHAAAWYVALGAVAVVRPLVHGRGGGDFLNLPRLVLCNVGLRHSQLASTLSHSSQTSSVKSLLKGPGRARRRSGPFFLRWWTH